MALEVIMPKAGVDMTEGQIVQWNKKVLASQLSFDCRARRSG